MVLSHAVAFRGRLSGTSWRSCAARCAKATSSSGWTSRRTRSSRARCFARNAIIDTRSRTASPTCCHRTSNEIRLRGDDARAVARRRVGHERLRIELEKLPSPSELREDPAGLRLSSEDEQGRGDRLRGREDEGLPIVDRIRGEEVRKRPAGGLRDRRERVALPRGVDDREPASLRSDRVRGREGPIDLRYQQEGARWDRRGTRDEAEEAEPPQPEGRALLRLALSRVVGEESDVLHGRHELSSDAIGSEGRRNRGYGV